MGYDDSLALLGLSSVEVAKNKTLSRKLVKLMEEVDADEYREWRSEQIKEGKRIAKECRERGITRL